MKRTATVLAQPQDAEDVLEDVNERNMFVIGLLRLLIKLSEWLPLGCIFLHQPDDIHIGVNYGFGDIRNLVNINYDYRCTLGEDPNLHVNLPCFVQITEEIALPALH